MSAGTNLDFQIYSEQFHSGRVERLQQIIGLFNAASNGTLNLVSRRMMGHFEQESFTKRVANLVARRDIDSVAAVADLKLVGGEQAGVKINRRIGPVADTLDAFRKQFPTEDAQKKFSFLLGQQTGDAITADYLNTGIAGLVAAISGVSALNLSAAPGTSSGRFQLDLLAQGMALFGDRASRLQTIITHSAPYFGLVRQTLADKIFDDVVGFTIRTGEAQTMNRRVLITDSPSLIRQAAGTSVASVGVVAGKFNKTGLAAASGAVVGGYITTAGFTNAANNGTFKVTAVTANDISVAETLVTETAGAGLTLITAATYYTLVLSDNALEVAESEEQDIQSQIVTGLDNLVARIQGEHAYNLKIKGYTWDITNGGKNPTDAAIATSSNWDLIAADNKDTAGVLISSLA